MSRQYVTVTRATRAFYAGAAAWTPPDPSASMTPETMATVPAHRIKQFGVEFYQAAFPAREIDRLVKFEVLGYGGVPEPTKAKRASRTRVNWGVLESRIGET